VKNYFYFISRKNGTEQSRREIRRENEMERRGKVIRREGD
jgi:hypothetical protein